MPLVLIRRPRSAKRTTQLVQSEVRAALKILAEYIVATLENDVKDWNEKPRFSVKVTVTSGKWLVEVKVNRRDKIGKIYTWVDEGTAERGDKGPAYEIVPRRNKKTNKYLGFDVPHSPKSLPFVPVPGLPSGGPISHVRTKKVMHPGIYPRRFTESLKWWLRSKKPGAFRSVLEAAVKRAFRKKFG